MECGDPEADSNAVEKVAWSALPTLVTTPLPNGMAPSKKVTNPVALPEVAVTVAVKVTVSPSVIVLADEVTVVVVLVCATAG